MLKYINKPDGIKKAKILEALNRKERAFPSKSWFLLRKPPQTKINNQHSTGLCKDCYSNEVNYDALLKHCKKFCFCKTERCPNWVCVCLDEEEECNCRMICECEDCLRCQVGERFKICIHTDKGVKMEK